MKKVESYKNLQEELTKNKSAYLLIYKKGADTSECAYQSIEKANFDKKINILTADVSKVRDIHGEYSVKTVPTLLSFEGAILKNIYKGCSDVSYYKSLFDNSLYSAKSDTGEKKQPSVTVYSTPSCSWCTRLKNYLKDNNIRFKDIDVSKDQKAAEAMVKRSGQQGVPQSIIAGQVIVGFDKAKIDKLLGL